MFFLDDPSRVLFDFDFITLGFVIELIQPSYVKGLHIVMCASFILSTLYPGLDHFTRAIVGGFFLRTCVVLFLRPHYMYPAYHCVSESRQTAPTAALDGHKELQRPLLLSFIRPSLCFSVSPDQNLKVQQAGTFSQPVGQAKVR